jgi:ABC-2 type transport system permease protein
VSAFGVPLLVLGGTFFPPDVLPPFLLRLAYLNPIYHMNEALKPVSALGAGFTEVRVHVAFLCVFSLLSVVLGTRAYRTLLVRERSAA